MRFLRRILLSLTITLSLLLIAWWKWSEFHKKAVAAESFIARSKVVHFKDVTVSANDRRAATAYQYDDNGVVREFITHRNLVLPPGGKARLGPDPSPDAPFPPSDIAVPLNGPDTVETVYQGMFRSLLAEDRAKPLVITIAALIAGIIGHFLQRQIEAGIRPPGHKR
jgi:hypothetical protein